MTPLPHSLCELLADRLDYAGLFPPAGLPMESAFRNYAAYQRHEHSWLLGRFVCPAGRLTELGGLVAQWPEESPLRLSVVGHPMKDPDYRPRVAADLELLRSFQVQHRQRVQIETFETSLAPLIALLNESGVTILLQGLRKQFVSADLSRLTVFLEFLLAPNVAVWARACKSASDVDLQFGLKFRFSGVEVTVIPASGEVARMIAACRDAGCVWKATAGLHQPMSARDDIGHTRSFGFVSLFAAATLAEVHKLPQPQIDEILQESSAENLRFHVTNFAWREISASNSQIAAARQRGPLSFGSCSFEEPIAGLIDFATA